MPLVRIDASSEVPKALIPKIGDEVHEAIVEVFKIPVRDKFQVLSQSSPGYLRAEDAGLGFDRPWGTICIQIFTQRGRSDQRKQALFKRISDGLGAMGVPGESVFIGYFENGPSDWSFANGDAQYMDGQLAVPSE